MADVEDYRRSSFETWEAMAPGWERRRDWFWEASRAVGNHMVERLDPQPGQTVLDLAAGPGDTGFAAARRLGRTGVLISSDFSPAMVELARRRAEELAIGNAEFRVLDAERMELEDASVDGVLCRWGYMLMADPAAALRESRRVLRPGGRLVFSVWGPPERNPWGTLVGQVLVERGTMPPPEPGAPGIFALADRDRIAGLLTAAGFSEPEIDELEMAWPYASFDDFWRFIVEAAGALAGIIAGLSPEERDRVRLTVEERVRPYRANGGYRLPGLCLNVVAD